MTQDQSAPISDLKAWIEKVSSMRSDDFGHDCQALLEAESQVLQEMADKFISFTEEFEKLRAERDGAIAEADKWCKMHMEVGIARDSLTEHLNAMQTELEHMRKERDELVKICELDIHIPDNLIKDRDQWKERAEKFEELYCDEEAGFYKELAASIARGEKLAEALKRECCCPGETNWTTGKEILCDACEALAEWAKDGGGE